MEIAAVIATTSFLVFAGIFTLISGNTISPIFGRTLLFLHMRTLIKRISSLKPIKSLDMIAPLKTLACFLHDYLADRGHTIGAYEAYVLILLGMCGAVGAICVISRSGAACIICSFGLIAAIPMVASILTHKQYARLCRDMPDVFRILGMGLSSGLSLTQAIGYVGVHKQGIAGKAFQEASLRLRCGSSISDVLEDIAQRLRAPGVKFLVTALSISQRTGSPLKDLFRRSAKLVEQQEQFKRLLMVKTAQVRLSVRVVSSLPVILICVLSVLSVDFQKGLSRPLGMASLCIACVLDVVALFVISHLMKGVFQEDI